MSAHNFIDLTGKTFHELTVIKRAESDKQGRSRWECRCACGNISTISSYNIKKGITKSCGCLRGKAPTHGMCRTPEYRVWAHMIDRCHNPKDKSFNRYGGRGIKVCKQWINSFQSFFDHIGKRPSDKHSIDRIANKGNYEPGNVRWATRTVQANNKRNNHLVTIQGETKTVAQWAKKTGVKQGTIFQRLYSGCAPEKAVFQKNHNRSKLITIDNVTRTNKQWSKISGIHPSAIIKRLKRGWSPQKAIFTPINHKNP